jgi:serine/threonine protein kinase
MNIGHLNLNSDNIIVDNFKNIRICEFKYSKFYSNNKRTKICGMGDIYFVSPEILSKKSCYPELSDIWSSGVILYLLTVGELPFFHQNQTELQKMIMKNQFRLPLKMSSELQNFFKKIFEENEESRFNLDQILNSDLFKKKKINKSNLQMGLNILLVKYPIDERVLAICKNNLKIEQDIIKQKLYNNIFDPITSIYKQIIAKFANKKISNEGDLTSKKYNNYINNQNNYFDEKTQKSNIQNILNLEMDFKQINKQKENDIKQSQQLALIELEQLLKDLKENPEKLRKRDNKSVDTSFKRKNKENADNKEINTNKITNISTIPKNQKDKNNNNIQKKNEKKYVKRNSINYGTENNLKNLNLTNKNEKEKSNMNDNKLNLANVNIDRRL